MRWTKKFAPATQYCDGLRGAFIIRDRNDPYLKDYDVDDGKSPVREL